MGKLQIRLRLMLIEEQRAFTPCVFQSILFDIDEDGPVFQSNEQAGGRCLVNYIVAEHAEDD